MSNINAGCIHCVSAKARTREVLAKYKARGEEMARQKDHFEAHLREATAELLATLRDRFAMAALLTVRAAGSVPDTVVATRAYDIADGMLEARKT